MMNFNMDNKYRELVGYGKMILDIQIPQVNTRIQNFRDIDGKVWYCRLMDGKVMDLGTIDDLDKYPRTIDYGIEHEKLCRYGHKEKYTVGCDKCPHRCDGICGLEDLECHISETCYDCPHWQGFPMGCDGNL